MKTIIKKDGSTEKLSAFKVRLAIKQAALWVKLDITDSDVECLWSQIEEELDDEAGDEITLTHAQDIVERALREQNPFLANSYKTRRNDLTI